MFGLFGKFPSSKVIQAMTDLLIPKRWRSRFTFERVTRITIPKRSQSQNCQVFIIYFHHISHHIVFSPSFSIFHHIYIIIYIFIFISAGKNDWFFSTTPIHQKFIVEILLTPRCHRWISIAVWSFVLYHKRSELGFMSPIPQLDGWPWVF